jgi:hypothetical protein
MCRSRSNTTDHKSNIIGPSDWEINGLENIALFVRCVRFLHMNATTIRET